MNLILTAGPNPASHVVVIQLCYLGARSVGDQFLQNIMSWEGERCLFKDVETRTFLTQQDSVVQVLSAQSESLFCLVERYGIQWLTRLAQVETVGAFVPIS